MVSRIYPTEFQLNKTNSFRTDVQFFYFDFSKTNGIIYSRIYDKWYDFDFETVNFPFLDGDVTHSLPMVYMFRSLIVMRDCVLVFVTSTTETDI